VVPNLWYVYPWGYVADWLGVRESNIGNGGKHCGLVVRVLGYRSGVGLERGPLSLVSTTEELLDRKVVAPV
jgi:hypothetical protein